VLKVFWILVSVAVALLMTALMASGIYANRSALPVVGLVFVGLLGFGLFW